ncbi:hypothetical protein Tco_1243495 [Tanacetum coccineum]
MFLEEQVYQLVRASTKVSVLQLEQMLQFQLHRKGIGRLLSWVLLQQATSQQQPTISLHSSPSHARLDEKIASKLQAEFDEEERLAREKDEANVALTEE